MNGETNSEKGKDLNKFLENATKAKTLEDKTKNMIDAKTERVCKNLIRIAKKGDIKTKYFKKLKMHSECQKKEQRILNVKHKKLKSIHDEIYNLRKKLDSLTKKKDNNVESLQRKIIEHQENIERLQMQKQNLECEMLVKQITEVEIDNSTLKQKIDSSQDNVGGFISEMSGILDSHEFRHMLDGADFARFDNFGTTDEYEHAQQHAGTGGSSKLRQARRHEEF
mmetsp:Transcript_21837/g.19373  ORF Transcript_21837/g.19373 Transcript_21837/m.19373 type:complete len:224 (-) Transcript_21837:53-724(-)